jgi:hypothetical protein
MNLPRPRPNTGVQRRGTATVGAAGTATFDITPTSTFAWLVSQVSIELATAPAGATAALRLDGVLVTAMIPSGDAAGGDPPILVQTGQTLSVVWAGCTPGTIGTVLVVYDEVNR